MKHHYVVIMAGGTGTRLWPLSRTKTPKQFLRLVGDETLIQGTVKNVAAVVSPERIFVMADAAKTKIAKKQLPQIPKKNFLIEPEARDNGPAIALATLYLVRKDPEAIITVLWSDHHMTKPRQFTRVLQAAFTAAKEYPFHLISIGIKPSYPATGFGYIRVGHEMKSSASEPVFAVERFVEKPDLAAAQRYVTDWRYLWNTGYKIFHGRHLLKLFAQHQPAASAVLKKIEQELKAGHQERVESLFNQLEKKDIERLITEKTKDILVLPADLGWSDIGTFNVLHDVLTQQRGEPLVVNCTGQHLSVDSERCLVIGQKKLIATVGLKDTIIIETADALLIADKSAAQDVKKIVEQLEEDKQKDLL